MKYYKYIKREINTSIYNTERLVFWKERYKRILKLIPILSDYKCEFKAIDVLSLPYNFIEEIYIPNINKKDNPNPSDIIERIKEWIKNGNQYIFLETRYKNTLVWWKILVIKQNIHIVSARSSLYEEHQIINQYMEYLFIKFWLENNMKTIGVWVSPNLCGYSLWSWPSVALHKLELHYKPSVTKYNEIWDINLDNINTESILFITEDDKIYSRAIIIRPRDKPHDTRYNLLQKRWIEIHYHYFN